LYAFRISPLRATCPAHFIWSPHFPNMHLNVILQPRCSNWLFHNRFPHKSSVCISSFHQPVVHL
jgi:hypothetical protein